MEHNGLTFGSKGAEPVSQNEWKLIQVLNFYWGDYWGKYTSILEIYTVTL